MELNRNAVVNGFIVTSLTLERLDVSLHWLRESGFQGKVTVRDGHFGEGEPLFERDINKPANKEALAARTPARPATPKFWMVIRLEGTGSSSCSQRHHTLERAQDEATRLAKDHRSRFVVLEAIKVCHHTDAPVTWESIHE